MLLQVPEYNSVQVLAFNGVVANWKRQINEGIS